MSFSLSLVIYFSLVYSSFFYYFLTFLCGSWNAQTVERDKDEKLPSNLLWTSAFWSLAKSCGFDLPAPVLSSSALMFVVFHSDETKTFGGFKATISFVRVTGNRSNLGDCLTGAAQRALHWIWIFRMILF